GTEGAKDAQRSAVGGVPFDLAELSDATGVRAPYVVVSAAAVDGKLAHGAKLPMWQGELAEEGAVAVEALHAGVATLGVASVYDQDRSRRPVGRDGLGMVELPGPCAGAAPLGEQRRWLRRCRRRDRELLAAVVPRVGDVDEALRRRRDPLRADELGIAEPRAAEHAEERAETREFLDAVIVLVGHVQRAVAVHRDAVRIAKGAGAVPERAPRVAKSSALVEVLDPVVAGIDHVERRVGRVDRDADRLVELTRPGPGPAEGRGEGAHDAEHLDPIVPRVGDEDVAARVGGDSGRVAELTLPGSEAAPLAEEGAGRVELLDTIVPRVDHVDVAERVDGDANRPIELPRAAALRAPARELVAAVVELDDLVVPAIDHVDSARTVDGHGSRIVQDPEADPGAAPLRDVGVPGGEAGGGTEKRSTEDDAGDETNHSLPPGIRRTLDRALQALRIAHNGSSLGEEIGAQRSRQLLARAERLEVVRVLDQVPDRLLEPLTRALQVGRHTCAVARLLGVRCLRQVLDELGPEPTEIGFGGHPGEQRDEPAVDRGERRRGRFVVAAGSDRGGRRRGGDARRRDAGLRGRRGSGREGRRRR